VWKSNKVVNSSRKKTTVKRETDNKSVTFKAFMVPKNILKNVSRSKHEKK